MRNPPPFFFLFSLRRRVGEPEYHRVSESRLFLLYWGRESRERGEGEREKQRGKVTTNCYYVDRRRKNTMIGMLVPMRSFGPYDVAALSLFIFFPLPLLKPNPPSPFLFYFDSFRELCPFPNFLFLTYVEFFDEDFLLLILFLIMRDRASFFFFFF
ncbi:hypothetical protein F4809DRAFT_606864, partial [Biscogniauxia mediterranea]